MVAGYSSTLAHLLWWYIKLKMLVTTHMSCHISGRRLMMTRVGQLRKVCL